MKTIAVRWIGIFVVVMVAAVNGWAHHGTSSYHMADDIVLTGTVKEWAWSNPHTWLWLIVRNSDGSMEEWSLENGPPAAMQRMGWSPATLKAGEEITVKVSPSRSAPKTGIVKEVRLSNGDVLVIRRPG